VEPTIRDARPSDARRFEHIRVAGWRTAYAGIFAADFLAALTVQDERVAQREQWLAELPEGHVMLVAEVAGEVAGGAILMPSRDDDLPDAAELLALYIDPARHGRGLGSALLAAGFAEMPQELQILWTLEDNGPARRFYERHGFVTDGARKVFDRAPRSGNPAEVRYRRSRLG
jgi:ribosomal protein S18 acetylase RimI-like enzyme